MRTFSGDDVDIIMMLLAFTFGAVIGGYVTALLLSSNQPLLFVERWGNMPW